MQQEPMKVVGNEFEVVDDEEDIVRDIIACTAYVEISTRSTVSSSGNSSGRESRQMGCF